MDTAPPRTGFPLPLADLCVKCGLCLPHCPTYGLSRHEGDSPRGRISLMQGLASGAITPSPALEVHLDGCLGCRACESVCPAKVPYGQLIDAGRALLVERHPQRARFTRLMSHVLGSAFWRAVIDTGLRLYRGLGLQSLLRKSGLLGHGRLARLESLLPARTQRRMTAPEARPAPTAPQALFTGCLGTALDAETLDSIRSVFAAFGLPLAQPRAQTCCGAVAQHGGLPVAAQTMALRNLAAFEGHAEVIYPASGCGATLKEYARLAPEDSRSAAFAERCRDAVDAALAYWPTGWVPEPLDATVAVHLPCTHRNVTGGSEQVLDLLHRIPGLRVVLLDDSHRCCGAAGTHFITQPDMADALLQSKLDACAQLQPDYVVSTNIGCSLHLAGGLRRAGGVRDSLRGSDRAPEVLHPLTLLARQLQQTQPA